MPNVYHNVDCNCSDAGRLGHFPYLKRSAEYTKILEEFFSGVGTWGLLTRSGNSPEIVVTECLLNACLNACV